MVKYILVAGGVISGIGKGVIGASSSSSPNSEEPSLHSQSSPSSPSTLYTPKSQQTPSHMYTQPPRSAHEPQSTIHTPHTLSRMVSIANSKCASMVGSPRFRSGSVLLPPSGYTVLPNIPDTTEIPDTTKLPDTIEPQRLRDLKPTTNGIPDINVNPNTLFSLLSNLIQTKPSLSLNTNLPSSAASDEMDLNLDPLSPISTWSFLTDDTYTHPLLAQPAPTSCHSVASSTGLLLKTKGLKVTAIKVDPYMNIDAGTMAPTEHGEVYVLNDGAECDLDLGNYERYLNISLARDNNITTGKVYQHVIDRERKGEYLGKTVQIVPHLTNAIQDWIERVSKAPVDETGEEPDVCIIELGGTVGDIESAPFVEAMRQFQFRVGHENFALVYVSLIPVVGGEQKTKPTQAGVRDLRGLGLLPDLIACRCEHPLLTSTMEKVSMFCHVTPKQVLGVHNVSSTYHVPLLLRDQGMLDYLTKRLGLDELNVGGEMKVKGDDLMGRWRALTIGQERLHDSVSIVLVGKYTSLQDSYMSVVKALEHASMRCGRKLILHWVDSSDLEPQAESSNPVRYHDAWRAVCSAKGIIVPGGFGHRGTEGMIAAVRWAREQKVPFLGICLGFQVAVVEWARNACKLDGANSAELVPETPHPVICFMPEISKTHMGGTMRLGLRPTIFESNTESSKLRRLYGGGEVAWERHRHRYEVEPKYVERLESGGGGGGEMRFVGKDERGERMQMLEIDDHPYFVALQAHPEFCSRPLNPSPPFLGLVAAACGGSTLDEQIVKNEEEYVAPHPESAKVVPGSEGVGAGKGGVEGKGGVKVNGDVLEGREEIGGVEKRLEGMGLGGEEKEKEVRKNGEVVEVVQRSA